MVQCAWLREGADIARPMAIPPVNCAFNKVYTDILRTTMLRQDGIAPAGAALSALKRPLIVCSSETR
jgi:hypothetical protein